MKIRIRILAGLFAVFSGAVATTIAPAVAAPGPAWVTEWTQFQGNARHSGVNRAEHTLNVDNVSGLALSWVGQVPGELDWASPVVAGGIVYITAGSAGLAVFPAAGCGAAACDPSWIGDTGPQAMAAPAVANGRVYVASQAGFNSNDGRISVFDAQGCGASVCEPLWKDVGGDESFITSSPAVSHGVVYIGSYDGKLYAFAAAGCGRSRCHPLWTADVGDHVDSSPAVANGVVYAGAVDGTFAAFPAGGCGAATCAPLWTSNLRGGINLASPTVAGGMVFIGNGRYLNALGAGGCGAATCSPLWRGRAEITGNTPVVFRGVVYVDAQPIRQHGASLGVVEAFDAHGCGADLCPPLWTGINFSNAPESSPVVANGVVYMGKGPASGFPVDSGVFTYDANGCGHPVCGALGFAQTGPEQFYLSSTPAVVDGRVYMGSTDTPTNQAGLYVFALPG